MTEKDRQVFRLPVIGRHPSKRERILSALHIKDTIVETEDKETLTYREYKKLVEKNEKWKASLGGNFKRQFLKTNKGRAVLGGAGLVASGAIAFAGLSFAQNGGKGKDMAAQNPSSEAVRTMEVLPSFEMTTNTFAERMNPPLSAVESPSPQALSGESARFGDGVIENTSELGQLEMKRILDRADNLSGVEDGLITIDLFEDGHASELSLLEIFEAVGATTEDIQKYEEFVEDAIENSAIVDDNSQTSSLDLATDTGFGADALALIARSAARDITDEAQEIIAGESFQEDESIKLIDFLEGAHSGEDIENDLSAGVFSADHMTSPLVIGDELAKMSVMPDKSGQNVANRAGILPISQMSEAKEPVEWGRMTSGESIARFEAFHGIPYIPTSLNLKDQETQQLVRLYSAEDEKEKKLVKAWSR